MANNALTTGFRARASQFLAWILGPGQQQRQQQTMQAERQIFDGVTRGMDDPDNRRQAAAPRDRTDSLAAQTQAFQQQLEAQQQAERQQRMQLEHQRRQTRGSGR